MTRSRLGGRDDNAMKIAIDVRCLMNNQYSGVSFYTLNLLKALFELDSSNEYILFYNSSKKPKMPTFEHPNVRYVGFNYPNKLFNLSLMLRGKPEIDRLIGDCDVFFVPNLNFLSLSGDCRKILTIHDLSFLQFPEFFNHKMRLWHKLVLKKMNLKHFDTIMADSQSTKNDIIDLLNIKPEKVKVNYLGVEEQFKQLESGLDAVKQKYNLPERFILYLGTLEPRKNVESIIEAYNDLNHDLVIAGGRGWKCQKIFKLAKNNPRIRFVDYIDNEDKPSLYNLADLFVCPSYYEGFGLPLLEAMACGTPVIAGNNSSQIEVVGNAGILVDPYNINDIKEAIRTVLSDDDLRQYLVKRGLTRAKEFSWSKTAAEILEVFQNSII